jgi:hypothetical protein
MAYLKIRSHNIKDDKTSNDEIFNKERIGKNTEGSGADALAQPFRQGTRKIQTKYQ